MLEQFFVEHSAELQSPNEAALKKLANTLREAIGSADIPKLFDKINDTDWRIAAIAIMVAGQLGDPNALFPLLQRLPIRDNMSGLVIEALVNLNDVRSIPIFWNYLQDDTQPNAIKASALIVLSKVDSVHIFPTLLVYLNSEDANFRSVAADALGKTGDARAVEPLIVKLRTDNHYRVRRHAADSLRLLKDKRATPALIEALEHDTDPETQLMALMALGEIQDERAVKNIIRILDRTLENMQIGAAAILGNFPNTTVFEPLAKVARDTSRTPDVRLAAIHSLQKLGDKRIVPDLEWVRDHDQTQQELEPPYERLADAARTAIETILAINE